MKTILVYITYPDKKEAREAAKALLSRRLIACANIFPIESFFRWEGKIENAREHVLLGKTVEGNYRKIIKEVEKRHSYSVPCVGKISASFNEKYESWVSREIPH